MDNDRTERKEEIGVDRSSTMSVLYANVQSVNNKLNELRAVLVDVKPDVVALTESWTNEMVDNEVLKMEGYDLIVRRDRSDTVGGRGGGILIYVRGVYAWDEEDTPDFTQCASVKIKTNGQNLRLSVVYRSPNSSGENDQKLYQWIREKEGDNVILGDFNFPGIKWSAGSADSRGRPFLDACADAFLTQHVEGPTHLSGNTLDLVLSSNPSMIQDVSWLGRIGASDHETMLVKVQVHTVRRKGPGMLRDFNRADFASMRKQLTVDWGPILGGLCAEEIWVEIKRRLDKAIEEHVPLRRTKVMGKPKWLNNEILSLIGKKRKAWDKWKKCRSEEDKDVYKKLEKCLKRKIRNAKNGMERKVAKEAKENPRAFYAYVNSAKRTRTKIGPISGINGEVLIDPREQAERLNSHYATVFTTGACEPPGIERMVEEEMDDVDLSPERVMEVIGGLRERAAPGPDGISNKIIMELREQLSFPLSLLYRKSLDSGHVPKEWKDSTITPIYKKGSRSDPANYRPVNLTSNICKLMEKLIKSGIQRHMEEHVLTNSQHGFRSGRSPQTNLIEFMDQVTKWVDDGKSVDVIYFDFSKAFDKVCHKRLAVKMEAAGIRGKVKAWICEWLSGRRQKVVVEGTESDWQDVLSSVPQGTVLGGILFTLYVNDIDEDVVAFLRKFVDDTKIASIVETDEDAGVLQKDVDTMVEWARKWEMTFNVAKCKVLHVGRRNKKHEYKMGDVVLGQTMEEKDLGIWISGDLKCGVQCEKAAKAANSALGLISRSFHYRSKSVLVPLYKTFVRPRMEYAVAVWSPWMQKDDEVLEKVQQRFVRMLSDVKGATYEEKLEAVGLTTLRERRVRGDMIETFKTMRGFNRVERDDWFTIQEEAEYRSTRLNTIIVEGKEERKMEVIVGERANLDVRKNFFTLRVENQWNRLPEVVKAQQSVNGFKNHYDRWREQTKLKDEAQG